MLGRIVAAMMNAKKRSASTSFTFQSARPSTTIPPATRVATAVRRAMRAIGAGFPGRAFRNRVPLDEHTFDGYNGVPNGSRRARRPRRPGAQPQGHHGPAPAERPHLHHRALGLRQVEPCLRHDLRRGPAPLRRVAERVRAPVPPDDGEARRRLDRRAQPGDLDRPEDDLAEPALDGRHGHRDLRLPAAPLRARRAAALPGLRPADLGPVDRLDRRADPRAADGHALHGQRAGRARPQGRVPRALRGAAQRGLLARQGRRRAAPARGAAGARQEVQAHDRGRRRPARDEGGPAHAAHAVGRDRAAARRGARRRRPRRHRRGASPTRRTSRAPSTASRCRSCSRASSRSTRRTARARAAPGSARSRRSIPTCSSPTRRSRSTTARSCRGRSAARASTSR